MMNTTQLNLLAPVIATVSGRQVNVVQAVALAGREDQAVRLGVRALREGPRDDPAYHASLVEAMAAHLWLTDAREAINWMTRGTP